MLQARTSFYSTNGVKNEKETYIFCVQENVFTYYLVISKSFIQDVQKIIYYLGIRIFKHKKVYWKYKGTWKRDSGFFL